MPLHVWHVGVKKEQKSVEMESTFLMRHLKWLLTRSVLEEVLLLLQLRLQQLELLFVFV
jgi:hypothetical protein